MPLHVCMLLPMNARFRTLRQRESEEKRVNVVVAIQMNCQYMRKFMKIRAPESQMKHADKVWHRVIETVYECNKSKPQNDINKYTNLYVCKMIDSKTYNNSNNKKASAIAAKVYQDCCYAFLSYFSLS